MAAGCTEALFTLGDKPELRYRAAADHLAGMASEDASVLRRCAALWWKRPVSCRTSTRVLTDDLA